MDHHIGVGEHAMHGRSHGISHLLGALKSQVAAQTNGDIGKITVSRSPDANPVQLQNALHLRYLAENSPPHTCRRGIQ